MEPGPGDREEFSHILRPSSVWVKPQWSPVLVAGKSGGLSILLAKPTSPQWSPVLVTGKSRSEGSRLLIFSARRNGARSW